MGTRIISGIVLLVLLIGLLYAGGPVLLVAMLVISLIGLYEFDMWRPFSITVFSCFGKNGCAMATSDFFSSSVCFGF